MQPTDSVRDIDQRLLTFGYDLRFAFGKRDTGDLEPVHLQLDEIMLPAHLSGNPVDRLWLAGIIERIAELSPKLIILNLVLDRPSMELHDQALASAFQQAGNVILRESSISPTLPLFKNSVLGTGVLKFKEDSTSTVQMVCNSAETCGGREILHKQIWKILYPDQPYLEIFPGEDWLTINYHPLSGEKLGMDHINLNSQKSESALPIQNRIIIIGRNTEPAASGLKTPLTLSQSDLSTESQILGQVVQMLISRTPVKRIAVGYVSVFLVLILLVLGLLFYLRYYVAALGLWVGSAVCWIIISLCLFAFHQTDLPFFLPIVGLSLFTTVMLLISLNREKIDNLNKALAIEKQNLLLKEAKIEQLTAQMNAHNVFNEFSRIKGMITVDPEKAKIYLLNFANMLRYSLSYSDKPLTSLAKHIEFIKFYLSQQESLNERVRFNLRMDSSRKDIELPWNTLFPLVENAVKYTEVLGKDNQAFLEIEMNLSVNADNLEFTVTNPYDKSISPASTNIGIKNLKERLEFFYNEKSFYLGAEQKESSWIARLRLPIGNSTSNSPDRHE